MQTNANQLIDCVIIGAGPAGLQLGYELQSAGRDYLILEGDSSPGAFFKRFPRHRKMISINKVYTGYSDRELQMRWDWNSLLGPDDDPTFSAYSREYFPPADALVRYLDEFARRHALRIQLNTRVQSIAKLQSSAGKQLGYRLRDQAGKEYRAKRVVVATGFTKPNLPAIKGIELAEPYTTMSVDANDYIDKRVLIIGKANSAFETADCLIPTARVIHMISPRPVEFAWRSHFVGHLRAVNNNFLDTYQLKLQNAVLDGNIDFIQREGDAYRVRVRYLHNTEVEDLVYDRVLLCAGFAFDPTIFDKSCRPEMRECGRLPLMTDEWESTNLPGVFFTGTLTQVRDYRKSSSGFIHGFRYNARALFRMLESRYYDVPWPSRELEASPEAITDALLERINRSSALWQQFGFLCDVVSSDGRGSARYYEELPLDYMCAREPFASPDHFAVTLEYGSKKRVDPFNQQGRVVRDAGDHGDQSAFLHPVVRHYKHGQLQATHHVIEDLAAEWREPEHHQPLLAFVRDQLALGVPKHSDIRALGGAARKKSSRKAS